MARSTLRRTACCASSWQDGEMSSRPSALGYLHRCKEKIAENLAYYQYIGSHRLDYFSPDDNNHAGRWPSRSWPTLRSDPRGVHPRAPPASEPHRVELGFLRHLCRTWALHAIPLCVSRREYILDLFEQLCGARLTLSYFHVGGVT